MLFFSEGAWSDYLYWQQVDKIKLKRVNALIKECKRTPFTGIGKPEPLKGNLSGYWSRRIDEEHRLVYAYSEGQLTILACKYHY